MRRILNTKDNTSNIIVNENDVYYELDNKTFIPKKIINKDNSVYRIVNEDIDLDINIGGTNNNQSTIHQPPQLVNDDVMTMDKFNPQAMYGDLLTNIHNTLSNTNMDNLPYYDSNVAIQEVIPSTISDKPKPMDDTVQKSYDGRPVNEYKQVPIKHTPFDDLEVDMGINSINDYQQRKRFEEMSNIQTMKMTNNYPIYSNMDNLTTSELEILKMYDSNMKKAKRKFQYKMCENFKIPRIDYISMMEEMNDVSIVDFIANHIVNEIMKNRNLMVDDIKQQIYDMLPEMDDDGNIIPKNNTTVENDIQPLSEKKFPYKDNITLDSDENENDNDNNNNEDDENIVIESEIITEIVEKPIETVIKETDITDTKFNDLDVE